MDKMSYIILPTPRLRLEIFNPCRPFAPGNCGGTRYSRRQQITVKNELSHADQTKPDMDIKFNGTGYFDGLVMVARSQLGREYVT